ncbi:MAG: glycosyltransferase family 4 protein, partial [Candidatus Binatia bacterium]
HPVPCQRGLFVPRAVRIVRHLLTTQRFDLTTTQTPFDDGLLGVWLKRAFRVPLNVQMRSSLLDVSHWIGERPIVYRLFNLLGKWVAQQADTIRVVSQGEKHRLEERFPALRGKITALHPLINCQIFQEPLKEQERERCQTALRQHGFQDRPFVLFVGRLVMQKNLPTLLRSFAQVRQHIPEASLVIAGDGPLRPSLKWLAQQLGLDESILWLGSLSLSELRGWYATAVATMLPSLHEGLAKVIPESYLVGTPVIAAPFVSTAELIHDGQTGFIAPDFTNQEWLADRMLFVLAHPEEAKKMGERGKVHIQQYLLDDALYMQRLIEIWQRTASDSSAS